MNKYKSGDIVILDDDEYVVVLPTLRKNYYFIVSTSPDVITEERKYSNVKPRKGLVYKIKRADKLKKSNLLERIKSYSQDL
jgi:hypothetical protein